MNLPGLDLDRMAEAFRPTDSKRDTKISRRKAEITDIDAVAGTVSIQLFGSDSSLGGVSYLASYRPVIHDDVWVDIKGGDPLVIGSTTQVAAGRIMDEVYSDTDTGTGPGSGPELTYSPDLEVSDTFYWEAGLVLEGTLASGQDFAFLEGGLAVYHSGPAIFQDHSWPFDTNSSYITKNMSARGLHDADGDITAGGSGNILWNGNIPSSPLPTRTVNLSLTLKVWRLR